MSTLPEGEVRTIRLRCIEAASKAPMTHQEGYVAAVMEAADKWYAWIIKVKKESAEDLM